MVVLEETEAGIMVAAKLAGGVVACLVVVAWEAKAHLAKVKLVVAALLMASVAAELVEAPQ